MTAREVLADVAPRLRAARDEIAELREQLDTAMRRRDGLIVDARAEAMTQKAIAAAAGVSQPHVIRILAAAEPSMVLPS